jgi:hypothetical protein
VIGRKDNRERRVKVQNDLRVTLRGLAQVVRQQGRQAGTNLSMDLARGQEGRSTDSRGFAKAC